MKILKSFLAITLVFGLLWSRSWLPEPDANADSDAANGILMSMSTDVPDVDSGRTFIYTINFSFSDLVDSGIDTEKLKLVLPLPAGVEFNSFIPLSILSGMTQVGNDLEFSFKNSGAGGPVAGTSYMLQINAHYTAHTTPDGTATTATAKIYGPDAGGNPTVELEASNPVTVTAHAAADWELVKERVSPIPTPLVDGQVQYKLTFNNKKSGTDMGVLDIENVVLKDTLPAEAEFVSAYPAPSSAPAPGETGVVTWSPAGTLADDAVYYVTVRYPAGKVNTSTTVTNIANVTYNPLGQTQLSTSANVSHGFTGTKIDTGPGGFYKNVEDRQKEISPGQDVKFYVGGFSNRSNSTLEDAFITDMTPTQDSAGNPVNLDLKDIDTATFHDVSVNYAVYYTTKTSPGAGDWVYWQSVSPETSEKLSVSSLNLGADRVMGVQFKFAGSLPVSFSQTSNFTLTYTLRSGSTITNGNHIHNTANLDYTFDSTPKHGSDGADVYVWQDRPLVRLDKTLVSSGPFVPSNATEASYAEFDLKVSNTSYSSAEFHDPVVFDVLPKGLEYVSAAISDSSANFSAASFALDAPTPTALSGDKTLLRWKFAPGTKMPVNSSFTIRVKAKIAEYAPATTYTNQAGVSSNNEAYLNDYYFNPLKTDTNDYDGDGSPTNLYIGSSADVTVNRVAELGSYKRVRGELDDDWKAGTFPTGCTFGTACDQLGNTVAGGRVDYKLTVKNNSNFDVDHVVVVDTLPRQGDEGALLGSRGSEWGTVLTEPLAANADYTVYYSTDVHAKINTSSTWSVTPPADLTTVTALKFEFAAAFSLTPGQEYPIVWSMKAPLGTTVDRIAWNSFAHQAQEKGTSSKLEPAEPPKVGVHINPPTGLSLGDYVWADVNKDGVQDAGEPGINGVKVELLKSDNTPFTKDFKDDGTTVHIPVATVTGPDASGKAGYYLFPNLPAGDYKVKFTMPTSLPEDYKYGSGANAYTNEARHFTAWTQKEAGSNRAVDSNVGVAGSSDTSPTVMTDVIHLTANDLTIDAGIEPPLGAIGDYVWYDEDGSGTQNEPAAGHGVSGVQVELFKQNGSTWVSQGTETTDANGKYLFDNLLPGKYKVKFPTQYAFDTDSDGTAEDVLLTYKDKGSKRFEDSNAYDLASATSFGGAAIADKAKPLGFSDVIDLQLGEKNLTVDAGYVLPVKLGDEVWVDGNADGKQATDPTDVPMAGVTVRLLTESGAQVKDRNDNFVTATTDSNGKYLFDHLLPRKYKVEFVLPTGYGFTRKGQGSAASDSNVNRSANNEPTLQTSSQTDTITSVQTPGLSDLTIDAGLVKLVALGDYVWNDKDQDGVQDAGEPGVSGIVVNLYYEDDSTTVVYRTATTVADGLYKFSNLYPGNYKVEFVRGNGYLFTINGAGTAASDSDAIVPALPTTTKAKTATIAMNAVDNMDIDAGLYELSSLGDKVWLDTNADGVQDAGESGVAGVQVQLLDGSGDPVTADAYGTAITTQTTAADGLYKFQYLNAGSYTVKFTLPTGYWFVQPNQGSDDAKDSDAIKQGTGSVGLADKTLSTGEHDMTIDAGIHTLASLGDFVWHDQNGDGNQDAGEPGKSGIKVELFEADGTTPAEDAYGNAVASQTTDANGNYKFINLSAGDYKVKFSQLPAGFKFTGKHQSTSAVDSDASNVDADLGLTDTVTLTIGQQRTDIDAGIVDRVSLGNFVWSDRDFDGIQDAGEPGVEGVTVKLYDAADLTTAIKTAVTDADGAYLFTNLWPGEYVVQFVLPSDEYMFTHSFTGSDRAIDSNADDDVSGTNFGFSDAITLVSEQDDLTIDAGLVELASLGDIVWHDANDNGFQDVGEIGFAGAKVNLLDGSGNPVLKGGVPVTTTTDLDGRYKFTKLVPGDYIVQFELPTDYIFAKKNATGSTASKDSDADPVTGRSAVVSLSPGENDVDTDAGLVKLTALGDYVWMDRNLNGIQDAGESGVAGVTVRLLDGAGSAVMSGGLPVTTTTDANGKYLFDHLVPGIYRVSFDLPAGYVFTAQDVGPLDTADSDADASAGGRTASVTLSSGEINTTLDAGLVKLVNLGDKLWVDLGAIGRQDGEASDPAASGVTVRLLQGDGSPVLSGGTPVTTVTDASGNYLFTNLYPGNYKVRFDLPSGYMFTKSLATGTGYTTDNDSNVDAAGTTGLISLTAGQDDLSIDAGIVLPAAIGDFVWEDADSNGIQGPDEKGRNGLKVELLDALGNVLKTTTTADLAGKPGYYKFDGLMPDTYKIKFYIPDGQLFTSKGATPDAALDSDAGLEGDTEAVTLTPGEYRNDIDAGFYAVPAIIPAALGDRVWLDVNGNGLQDDSEKGLNGVTIELYNRYNALVATKVTANDADGKPGYYAFTGLNPEDYTVKFILPAGYQFTKPAQGTDRSKDSNADSLGKTPVVSLIAGMNDKTIDAGLIPLSSIGDYVWIDSNANGRQDAGEVGLNDVEVSLYDADGNEIATQLTGNDAGGKPGYYAFKDLTPGAYRVGFKLPNGYAWTAVHAAGSKGDNDSDAGPDGRTGVISLQPGASDLTVDAGLVLKKDEPQTPDIGTGTDNGGTDNPGSVNPGQGNGNTGGTGGNGSGGVDASGNSGSEDGGADGGSNGASSGASGSGSANGGGQLPKTGETAPIYPLVGYGLIAASLILFAIRLRNRKPKRTL
ncbi:SdrD B-like domain-containing protein [Cohnella sp. GCM10020058]|uniref:SdrD B-like domain-containing protein n=1 Tax=Cohnella sp. GCM10020058 TaxID=3317330 RepID=UPI0036408F2C